MELGVYSFAELHPVPGSTTALWPKDRLRDLLEEIELADRLGLDVFGVGEHHRPDFAVSAPRSSWVLRRRGRRGSGSPAR